MRLKRQPRGRSTGAHAIVYRFLSERCTNGDIAIIRQAGGLPGGEAVRVAEVGALISSRGGGGGGGGVEIPEEIQFFAWIVFVHVDGVAREGVEGVFDGPEAGGRGVFDDTLVLLVVDCEMRRMMGGSFGRQRLTTSLRKPQPRTCPSVAKL